MAKRDNPKLQGLARANRKTATKEENHLWYDFLKQLPMRFNRQKVIGPYIVDFYCAQAKLVIELDGRQHYGEEGMIEDQTRDSFLNKSGICVIRYSNDAINRNFNSVCDDIVRHLQARLK